MLWYNSGITRPSVNTAGNVVRGSGNRARPAFFPVTSLGEDALQFVHFCWRPVSLIEVLFPGNKNKLLPNRVYCARVVKSVASRGCFATFLLEDAV